MSRNAPYGETRWIVVCPVASLVVIPERVFAVPFEYAVAPWIVDVRKLAALQPSLSARSIPNVRSDAFTGAPFEYVRPLRIVNVYVLPPSLTVGSAVATDGMICVPAV